MHAQIRVQRYNVVAEQSRRTEWRQSQLAWDDLVWEALAAGVRVYADLSQAVDELTAVASAL